MKTIVLPTSRSIRQSILRSKKNAFLENYVTIGEFLNRCIIVEGLRGIDEDTRIVFLLEAAAFENFSKLQIERNFLSFTKNASLILSFFEELATENVDIEDIPKGDIYAEYEEHLTILNELRKRYKELCLKHRYFDKIFLSEVCRPNEAYLATLGTVELYIDGILGNFELDIIEDVLKYAAVTVVFESSGFNEKMRLRLNERFALDLQKGYGYKVLLNEKKVLEKTPLKKPDSITLAHLSQKSLQAAFVKERIAHFVQKGYDPQKIAVVLPDESFAVLLELFDTKNNFNFAMGKKFSYGFLYKKLQASLEALVEPNVQNFQTLKRFGEELYEKLLGIEKKLLGEVDLELLLDQIASYCQTKEETEIFKEERYLFAKLKPHIASLSVVSGLKLFLSRLAKRSFDDVGGGKITVMGLLETRGVDFDAVIVCDFSDAFVPKRLEKDMFLNSEIKKRVGLPTQSDREELQKHLYASLFRRSQESALCYVENDTQTHSRFVNEIEALETLKVDETLLASILLEKGKLHTNTFTPFTIAYDFTQTTLSSTKLTTYLECTRKFYLRYIRNIEGFRIPRDLPEEWEISKVVHKALKNLYTKKNRFDSKKELCNDLFQQLELAAAFNPLEQFQIAMYKELLQRFCDNEIERFAKGYAVLATEKELETKAEGLRLYGVIDRIDLTHRGTIEVLDYKTGSYNLYTTKKQIEEAKDFQLEFYYLLSKQLGEMERVGFYDLQIGKIVEEKNFYEKLDRLNEHLRQLAKTNTLEVTMCEDTSICRKCNYKTICGRE